MTNSEWKSGQKAKSNYFSLQNVSTIPFPGQEQSPHVLGYSSNYIWTMFGEAPSTSLWERGEKLFDVPTALTQVVPKPKPLSYVIFVRESLICSHFPTLWEESWGK